jgi:hypothetical protein
VFSDHAIELFGYEPFPYTRVCRAECRLHVRVQDGDHLAIFVLDRRIPGYEVYDREPVLGNCTVRASERPMRVRAAVAQRCEL